MDDSTLYSIGDLARRTGLPVRTIRFYSDSGVLPPTNRSPAGHRLYDLPALTRLDLVHTLRDLGVDLPTIRQVLQREISVPQAAAAHAEALEVQIRILRLRQAVLRVVADRGSSPEEMELMHKLAKMSDAERHRIIHQFIDDVFADLDANPEVVAMLRAATPDLPDDPTPAQIEAWIELAELVQDPDFRTSIRRMAEYQAAERAAGDHTGLHHDLTNQVRDIVEAARGEGIGPTSDRAAAIVDDLIGRYARSFGKADTAEYRRDVLTRLNIANDPRAERYWHLIAAINGWPVPPTLVPVFDWFIEALEHHRAAPPSRT
jgi:DNA-binding transcriptional MerR regulator